MNRMRSPGLGGEVSGRFTPELTLPSEGAKHVVLDGNVLKFQSCFLELFDRFRSIVREDHDLSRELVASVIPLPRGELVGAFLRVVLHGWDYNL